jgi:hypothetical protein
MLKTSITVLSLALSQLAFAGGDPYPTAACMSDLAQDARLQPLLGKVALGDDMPGLVDGRPTAEERAALRLWSDLRQECFTAGSAHRAAAHIDLPASADRFFAMQQALLGELREGRIGFTEFNARSAELTDGARSRQAEILRPDNLHKTALSQR